MRFLRALAAVASLLVGWLLCWTLWPAALWWAATAWGVRRRRPTAGWLLHAALGTLLVPASIVGYQVRHDRLAARVHTRGAHALAVPDRVAVYGLNLVMAGAGAALGFPEVALETASLAVPHGRDRLQLRSDRFPLCVPDIAQAAQATSTQRITWSYEPYRANLRGALALNPATVSVVGAPSGRWVHTTVPIDYPPRYRMVFARLGGRELAVDEGLFHALETLGWLHPYELTYRSWWPDDVPAPTPCEAWSVRGLRTLIGTG